jgi:hypothetical protein
MHYRLLFIPVLFAHAFQPIRLPWTMRVNKIALTYDFPRVPFEVGVAHIHSPEHISETHRLGAPFFRLDEVCAPKYGGSRASVTFFCSTLFMKRICVRMFTDQPNHSNLLFIDAQGRALYRVRLVVVPTQGFSSHQLVIEISLFTGWFPALVVAALMPIFLLINGLEDRIAFGGGGYGSDPRLSEYRRIVMGKLGSGILDFGSEVYARYRDN